MSDQVEMKMIDGRIGQVINKIVIEARRTDEYELMSIVGGLASVIMMVKSGNLVENTQ